MSKKIRVAVIGAGAAGLAAARHLTSNNNLFTCEVYEQAGQLGGTWLYSDRIGTDEYGFPLHSSMYKGLRTNLPKEIMGFPDFAIPDQAKSYLAQEEILQFLNSYADHFQLRQYVRFHSHVKNVAPLGDRQWTITIVDVCTREETETAWDAVIVCNGHYNVPSYPDVVGRDRFKGKQCHSHDYRTPDAFAGSRVLVIGAGPSGMDLALQLSHRAKNVYMSHHSEELNTSQYPSNVVQKPDVVEICENSVRYADGTASDIDAICYCTGYKYSFPFLDARCGISADSNHIKPLYKHMIHIERTTMSFIGIPFNVCAFQMFDLQARWIVQSLNGNMALPAKEEMYRETQEDLNRRWKRGYTKRQAHMMGPDQQNYYDDLAKTASIHPIARVIVKLRMESEKRFLDDFTAFREDRYRLVDSENFVRIH